ncbi:hypothetical protein K435DRAFT_862667 [Dendrothele bispora CBS 962.96]|uniref:Uncharacterized protein n=1 Tax=Dendrothele bispora (strain CBS 962.96) TaxID=1314807 RepID=A0A4V4HES0_DENBC|nr:hypothetical protein K435DRAFT_862667 [Dendrothele bispora CBS 962.96]
MDIGKALFLAEETCLTGNINEHYGNPPLEISRLDCKQAGRKVYCSRCALRYDVSYDFKSPESSTFFAWLPLSVPPSSKSTVPHKSKTSLGKHERASMRIWLLDFRKLVWSQFEPYDPLLSHYPVAWFFSDSIINAILDNFLKIDSMDNLLSIMQPFSWKFIDSKSDQLFRLISDFQQAIHDRRAEEKKEREEKQQSRKGKVHSKGKDQATDESEVELGSGRTR